MTRRGFIPALGLLAAVATAAPALAQQSAARPPLPPSPDPLGATVFLYYAVIAVLAGATIAVSVMPGKRGHQD